MRKYRICIVTPGSLACNPRVVKEADALHGAGFKVTVVSSILGPLGHEQSEALLDSKPWKKDSVQVVPRGFGRQVQRITSKLAREMTCLMGSPLGLGIAEWRHSPLVFPFKQATAQIDADMYIAHYIPGLAAAGPAAVRRGVPLGFDAEDAHHIELRGHTRNERVELAARGCIEKRWLPRCTHLTAAAPLIAESYAKRYGVHMSSVLNVFPLEEAPANPLPAPKIPSLYWFSQKIGPGRGLEEMLPILSRLGRPVELSLRGVCSESYRRELLALTGPVSLTFLPPAPASEMARLAASSTAGLCVELPFPPHHDICLANKLFTFLLAGIPSILSKTAGHRDILQSLGDAALMIDLTDTEESARTLAQFFGDDAALNRSRKAAWEAAQAIYNWESEQELFLSSIDRALGRKAAITVPLHAEEPLEEAKAVLL